ncbi:hypothetical protein AMAG_00549 [Allomyces macrogynus ATCC 38327]|uniref:Wings apart-like protein C-terminal domain-containing protein n=1 Tax=Allomyces macrogynus (strain ATCC 38327) TaxID=578462 RepID=A0A0L0RW09_ALLM3|nr:hypothetical protein AMAG_00549 [Allomyces macrogynus ATCC 38327]|eukprot:KNE54582.1 hypothetical protein AMAG_00549 [Allomyces macrogynus ATCC 38327]
MATPPPPHWATAAPSLGTAPAITYGKRSRSSHRISAPSTPTASTPSRLFSPRAPSGPDARADDEHETPPGGADDAGAPVLKKPRLSSSPYGPRPKSRIGKPSDPFAFDLTGEPALGPSRSSFLARKITLPKSVFPDRAARPAVARKPPTPRKGRRNASPPKLALSRSLPTSTTNGAIDATPLPPLVPPPPAPAAPLATEHPAAISNDGTVESTARVLNSSLAPPDAFDVALSASPLDADITPSTSPPPPPPALFPSLGDSSSLASSLPASRSNSLPAPAPPPPRVAINPQRDVFLGSFFDDSDEDDDVAPAGPALAPATNRSVEQKSRPRITRKNSELMAKEIASRLLTDDVDDDEPTAPFEVKARHELREAGEILRLKEELDYLVDGLRSTSVNIRRFSAMDVLRKLSQRTVRRQAMHVILPVLGALAQDKDAIVLLAFLGVMLTLTTDTDAARPLLMDSRFGSLLVPSHILDLVKGAISVPDDKKSQQLAAEISTKLDALSLPSYLDQDHSPTSLWLATVHALIRFSSELAMTSLGHAGITLVGDLIAWDATDVTPVHSIALDILERASFYANLAGHTLATAFPITQLAPSIAAQYDALRPLPFDLPDPDRAVAVARVAALLATMRVAINVTSDAPAAVCEHFSGATECLTALADVFAGPAPVLVAVADDVRAHVVTTCGAAETAASQGSAAASQHAEIWAANAADRADRQVVAVGLLVNIAEHADEAAAYLAGVRVRDVEVEDSGDVAFPVALDRVLADAAVEEEDDGGVPRVVPLLTAVLLALVLRHAPTPMRGKVDLDRVRSRLQEFVDMHAGLDAAEAVGDGGAGSQSQPHSQHHEHDTAVDPPHHHHLVSVTAYTDLLHEVESWSTTA